MANRLDMSTVTYKRIEGGKRELSLVEIDRISEICGWARGIFSLDFNFQDGVAGGAAAEQLSDIEGNLHELVARLSDLEWQTRQNVGAKNSRPRP